MFGLSFLYPLFLAGLAAAAIPVALHLFRRKTELVVDFPAVRLLHKAPVERERRRRLREVILLVLRVAALALLAVAFARPYVAASAVAVPAPITMVALDTSLSLSAPGQFDRAREAARQALANAPAAHRVALLTFADAASLVVGPTTNRGAALAAIDQVQAGEGGTRYRTALARAAEGLAGAGGAIVVVTDLQQVGWEAADEGAVPDGVEVTVVGIPPPTQNLAVTSVRRDGDVVTAGVHNFGLSAVSVAVRLEVGERVLATTTVEVAAQGAAEARLTGALPSAGGAAVRIEDADGYQADNVRYFVLDPAAQVPIFVVTATHPDSSSAGLYLERALGLADEGRAFAVRVLDGRTFSSLDDRDAASAGAFVILGTSSLERSGRERIARFIGDGGRVLLTLGPDIDHETLADIVGAPVGITDGRTPDAAQRTVTLVAVDTRHPIFRPFLGPGGALGDIYVERYHRLRPSEAPATVLARFTGVGDALVEQPVGQGRVLVFASDLDNRWNRFPLTPSFVPWAIETARYLTQGRHARQSFTLPEAPPGGAPRAGIQRIGERHVAVNADVRESNSMTTTTDEFDASVTRTAAPAGGPARAAARDQEERQRLWQLGLLVMFVALASEGMIGRKAV